MHELSIPEDIVAVSLYGAYLNEETARYTVTDGVVRFNGHRVQGADPATFSCYPGGFAKDQKHAYAYGKRLKGSCGHSFKALNYCWYTDECLVWALGGAVRDADASSFQACDDGFCRQAGPRIPMGYARDTSAVYYYGFEGKPGAVRKADPDAFRSLNDGKYGVDQHHVFYGKHILRHADARAWSKIGGLYSKDKRRVFYDNRDIPDADCDTFETLICDDGFSCCQLARDKNTYYWNGNPIPEDRFRKLYANERRKA